MAKALRVWFCEEGDSPPRAPLGCAWWPALVSFRASLDWPGFRVAVGEVLDPATLEDISGGHDSEVVAALEDRYDFIDGCFGKRDDTMAAERWQVQIPMGHQPADLK